MSTVIVGVLATITVMGSNQFIQGQEAKAAISSIRQIIWQGASAAASRGQTLELVRTNNVWSVRTRDVNPVVVRQVTVPASFSTTFPSGATYRFLPPGRLDFNSVASSFTASIRGTTYTFTVSQIGEVNVQ